MQKTIFALSHHLSQWRRFVLAVEEGYQLTIYDYTNDLSTRDLLEKMVQQASCGLLARFKEQLVEWDRRFLAATRRVKRPLIPALEGEHLGWWWYRIPKTSGRELEEDLRQLGFL